MSQSYQSAFLEQALFSDESVLHPVFFGAGRMKEGGMLCSCRASFSVFGMVRGKGRFDDGNTDAI